ncbi:MAG: ABC transporter substrate-binding protein [Spirochaetia bacterium]|nr:ABC transporter substrate-binding protein [Spirochaetia bacterium]
MRKTFTVIAAGLLLLSSCLWANGQSETPSDGVYFLNFKSEITKVYENQVIPAFEKETGIDLKVVTAGSGTYAQTLKSEMAKSVPPTVFQTNGPVGLATDKDNAMDLKDTDFYKLLADKSMALTADGKIAAVPYAVEGYGIIYNDKIMRAYFALPDKKTAVSSVDQINNFVTLKAVVEDMTAHKAELGIKGVFASTSMAAGTQWRWQTHLVNIPLYYEFAEKKGYDDPVLAGLASPTITFKYGPQMKQIFDLYINNSCTPASLLGSKSVDDSMAEFALGQCAMVQNGNWAASQILGVDGNTVANDDIRFMPIYMGIPGEEKRGLCIGTENYLCINSHVSAQAQKNSDKFLSWLFSSKTGKQLCIGSLGFITPFNSFSKDELPADPLGKEIVNWMNKPGLTSVPWAFQAIPSENWKNDFGAALLSYAQGQASWDQVMKTAVNDWASEYKLTHTN